ncbi:MAG: hypothetical protein K8S00_01055 [Bacteroidales bacterium]|nr:hypothetical protein [Bacteroidales bacterium]
MKKSIILIALIFLCLSVFSQSKGPKISAKQLNQISRNAQEIQKINEVITSFNDVTASLNKKLSNINTGGSTGTTDMQSANLDTVFQILEATNQKMSVIADSLSTIYFTMVSNIEDTNKKFDNIKSDSKQNLLYPAAALALVSLIGLILFIILFIRMGRHNKKNKLQFTEIKANTDEELKGMIKSLEEELAKTKQSLEARIRVTDNTLSRRMRESSAAFEKQIADLK